uniref:Uncharacterized protein n=1 Tax=Rhizophora mucronata TaxID=61149 RepID=A0A2P2L0I3_RHIMU
MILIHYLIVRSQSQFVATGYPRIVYGLACNRRGLCPPKVSPKPEAQRYLLLMTLERLKRAQALPAFQASSIQAPSTMFRSLFHINVIHENRAVWLVEVSKFLKRA